MKGKKESGWGRTKERIARMIQERPSHGEVLSFLGEVMTEQNKIRPGVKTAAGKMDRESMKAAQLEGFPLLGSGGFIPDIPAAAELFERLCRVLDRKPKVSPDAQRIREAFRDGAIDLAALTQPGGAAGGEDLSALAERLGVKESLLSFLVAESIRPVFEAYADELQDCVEQEAWWRGYCPICGSPPGIAKLREEGERFLVCSACSFAWRFKRLMCPFCGNEDQRKMRYFHTAREGMSRRVDVCEKCRRYIKAIDTGGPGEEAAAIVEDMGTLYLDALAQGEGYKREGILLEGAILTGGADASVRRRVGKKNRNGGGRNPLDSFPPDP